MRDKHIERQRLRAKRRVRERDIKRELLIDGDTWRDAVKVHGRETVVEMVTGQFADTSV